MDHGCQRSVLVADHGQRALLGRQRHVGLHARDQHWQGRHFQQLGRHRLGEVPAHPCSTMARHDDQIAVTLLRRGVDGLVRLVRDSALDAIGYLGGLRSGGGTRQPGIGRACSSSSVTGRVHGRQQRAIAAAAKVGAHMEKGDACAVMARQLQGLLNIQRGQGASVDRNEQVLVHGFRIGTRARRRLRPRWWRVAPASKGNAPVLESAPGRRACSTGT